MVLENFIVDAPIVWDRVGKKIFENPHVKQGRKMRVQITNAGMVEDLSGYTLALGWRHTVSGVDGLDVFEDDSEANVGIFEMAYTENLMTNLGNLKASLVLTSFEDMVVAESNDFYVKVDDSPFGADAEQGVGSYTRLAQILLNEEIRDAEFDNAQFDRNVDFEVANTDRNEAFALAQTQRNTDFGTDQAARVLAFNNAETARVNAFNLAEAARAEGYATDHARAESDHTTATSDATLAATDRTNAATDRTNAATDRNLAAADHTRAESDHTRADADSATVGGYNARLTDVEVDTSFDATNLVTNGDFSNGTTGWLGAAATLTVSANTLSLTGDGTGNFVQGNQTSNSLWTSGKKVYRKARVRVTNDACLNIIVKNYNSGGSGSDVAVTITAPIANQWYDVALVFTNTLGWVNNVAISLQHKYADNATALGKVMEVQYVTMLDLTTLFGAGKEPTAAEMDRILAKFPNSWFDGTKNLFQAKASLNKLMALDARTEFEAKNGIINGNFSNGVVGWGGSTPLTALGNGTVKATPTGVTSYVEPNTVTTIPAKNGNKIYMASYIKSSPDATNEKLMIGAGTTQVLLMNNGSLTHPSGAWLSAIATLSGQTDGRMITAYVSNAFSTAEIAGASSFSFGYVTLIDLTATFGAGKEPTLAEMDRLMARFPNSWFDGVKPIQTIETLYQEKANKMQEEWITPTLLNGWVGILGAAYMKDTLGFVHLKGRLESGTNGTTAFTLPAGYRPSQARGFVGMTASGSFGRINAYNTGNIEVSTYGTYLYLDGITFKAEV